MHCHQVAIFVTIIAHYDLSTVSVFVKWWILGGGTFLMILQLYTIVIYAQIVKRLKAKGNTPRAEGARGTSTPLSRKNSLRFPVRSPVLEFCIYLVQCMSYIRVNM